MNSKELVQNTINLKSVERIPAALLSGGSWALNSRGFSLQDALGMEAEEVANILLEVYLASGVDIVWAAPGSGNLVVQALGGKLKFRPKGPPDVIDPPIKKHEDIDHINLDVLSKEPSLGALQKINRHIVEKIAGKYQVAGSMWGPITLAGLLYGAENLMRDMYRNSSAVHHLLDFTANLFLTYVENYFTVGIDLVSMGEPFASGDMISRKHFAEFVVPVLSKIFSILRAKNNIGCLHICGNIEDRLDLIADTGAHILSMDYKVSLQKARTTLGGKMAFAGNINPVDVMLGGSPEEVAAACRQCIADAGDGGGFILMPGCDIPPTTPAENVRTMTESVFLHEPILP